MCYKERSDPALPSSSPTKFALKIGSEHSAFTATAVSYDKDMTQTDTTTETSEAASKKASLLDDAHIDSSALRHHASWLRNAIFYEIYPQSFADSNGDGIGDIPGITAHLRYIRDLGCTALWINPCFESPFRDAGYDISNYERVAPRYGTNDDLIDLFKKAHALGMHVLLDLVPGHTSDQHPWFRASSQWDPAKRIDPKTGEDLSKRFIWTQSAFENGAGMPFVAGESDRDGAYITNFFAFQPALNYGYLRQERDWQQSIDDPAPTATRHALAQIMRFWLSRGCDGFRVDMADSLVKNDDENKSGTITTWQRIFSSIKKEFPQAAFVSEWGRPWQSLTAGFDMDFYLDWGWVPNGYNLLVRRTSDQIHADSDQSYMAATSNADPLTFLADYLTSYTRSKDLGSFSFITCNHDTPRFAPRLSKRERELAFTLLMTLPGMPFIYYGDEIGMRYRILPSKEGGYGRTGSRTPMQWDNSANKGFSTADSSQLYLPVDPSADAPTVEDEKADPSSMLSFVTHLLALRHDHDNDGSALAADADLSILFAHRNRRPLVFMRTGAENAEQNDGTDTTHNKVTSEQTAPEKTAPERTAPEKIVVALNPETETEQVPVPVYLSNAQLLLHVGTVLAEGSSLSLEPQSCAIFKLN